jgi:hypothetical protein
LWWWRPVGAALRNLCVFECVCIPTSPSWCPWSYTNVSGTNTLARRTICSGVRSGVRHTPEASRRPTRASLLRCTRRVCAVASDRCHLHRSSLGSHALDRLPSFGSRGPRATPPCALAEALPRRRQVESARLEMGSTRALRDLSPGFWLRTAIFTRIRRRSCSNSQDWNWFILAPDLPAWRPACKMRAERLWE